MTTPTSPQPDPTPDTPDAGGPRRTWPWIVLTIVAVLVLALILWLVNRPDETVPAEATPEPTSSASASPSDDTAGTTTDEPTDGDSSEPAAEGCPAAGDGVPDGAGTHEIVDVDGDGEADTAWITAGAGRTFGITTASGATFSVEIDSAAPIPASAVVNIVAAGDGTAPIALVDTGRSVQLFSAAGCALTPTQNADGDPYTFDKGFAGNGTGVGCTEQDGELHLAGLNATSDDDGTTFAVTRTFIDLDQDAKNATNGDESKVADDAGPKDPVVVTAQETSCGDLLAGKDGPAEPQS